MDAPISAECKKKRKKKSKKRTGDAAADPEPAAAPPRKKKRRKKKAAAAPAAAGGAIAAAGCRERPSLLLGFLLLGFLCDMLPALDCPPDASICPLVCRSYKKEVPRPTIYDACAAGCSAARGPPAPECGPERVSCELGPILRAGLQATQGRPW